MLGESKVRFVCFEMAHRERLPGRYAALPQRLCVRPFRLCESLYGTHSLPLSFSFSCSTPTRSAAHIRRIEIHRGDPRDVLRDFDTTPLHCSGSRFSTILNRQENQSTDTRRIPEAKAAWQFDLIPPQLPEPLLPMTPPPSCRPLRMSFRRPFNIGLFSRRKVRAAS